MKKLLLSFILVSLLGLSVQAQIQDRLLFESQSGLNTTSFPMASQFSLLPVDSTKEISFADKTQNFIEFAFKYFPLPFGGYATETSWVLGITKYNAWKFKSATLSDSLIQPSSVIIYYYFTGEHQYKFDVNIDLMHHSNKYNSKFDFVFLDYPSLFFGLGNENERDSGYMVDYKNLMLTPTFYYNVYENIYIGAKYTFNNFIDVKNLISRSDDSLIQLNEGIQSGLGFHMYRESRDNRIRANKGSYLNVGYDYYGKYLGSDFNFGAFVLDYRKYYTPIPQLTLAGQFYSELTHGDIPIQSMPVVGGA
ncbi:MAG: BamA/TamA family outer membrane protein, partial [Bacteroidales bacterium]|nr:BamA/TamA family outer membrane protein [Bacteroidales bacterium]